MSKEDDLENKLKNLEVEMEEYKSTEEYTAIKKLEKMGIQPSEVINLAKTLEKSKPIENVHYKIGKSKVKYVAFGDTHIGNKNYKPHIMTHIGKLAKKDDIDFVACTGDILDGWYQNRPQSLFEQNAIGLDQQLNMATKELSKLPKDKPVFFITGNHTYNTYMRGAGIEVGPKIVDMMKNKGFDNFHYLGNGEGDIILNNGSTIKMLHPDGGTAYAISYRSQKIAESLTGGEKPEVLLIGHFHKAEYIFYRNIHIFQTGTLEGQTKFMRGKHIPAHTGFWVIEMLGKHKNRQIDAVKPMFIPKYD